MCWHLCWEINSNKTHKINYCKVCEKIVSWTTSIKTTLSSVQFSRSVMSYSLRPHGLQHTRSPCPSPTPWVNSNSYPWSQWCHPTISSSVIPFSYCLQSFPASGSFQWVSSSHQVAKVLEFQLQHQSFQWIFSWFPLGLTSLIFSNTTVQKHQPSLCSTLTSIHDYSKNHSFDYMVLCWQNNVSAF